MSRLILSNAITSHRPQEAEQRSQTSDRLKSSTMSAITPSPLTWTLRFKHHKSTTLLHVDPLQSMDSMKSELLRALQIIHTNHRLPNGTAIPSKSSDVIFGIPVDVHDLSLGWKRVDADDDDFEDDAQTKNKKSVRAAGFPKDNPTAAGLKDGSVVAYRFTTDGAQEDEGISGVEEDKWDVVLPSMDDTNEGR